MVGTHYRVEQGVSIDIAPIISAEQAVAILGQLDTAQFMIEVTRRRAIDQVMLANPELSSKLIDYHFSTDPNKQKPKLGNYNLDASFDSLLEWALKHSPEAARRDAVRSLAQDDSP